MDQDLRLIVTPLAGAAGALALGLWLGGAMQPQLIFGRTSGPQMLSGLSGERAPGPMDLNASFVSYSGRVPDYVIGTDVIRALEPQPGARFAAEPAYAPRYDPIRYEPVRSEPAETQLAYSEPAPAPPTYPSVNGGQPPAPPSAPAAPEAPDAAEVAFAG